MPQKKRAIKAQSSRLTMRPKIISVTDEKHGSFLDVFSYAPDNVTKRSLGKLFGLFSIDPKEQEAAYIVNFLTSVIKKEYYARPHRSVTESFEVALKKANLALGEIAKEGNLSWLGSLDGVVCVNANNTLHFSTCGSGKLFLIREKSLIELSNEEPSDIPPHPLKTFEDIASGKVFLDDIVIASDRQLTYLLSPQEIEKEALLLEKDDLFRLLHTALVNECKQAGTIIAHVDTDNETLALVKTSQNRNKHVAPDALPENFNVFNKDTFTAKKKGGTFVAPSPTPEPAVPAPVKPSEYTDKKTGHIYIRQNESTTGDEKPFSQKWTYFQEMLLDSFESVKFSCSLLWRKASSSLRSRTFRNADTSDPTPQSSESIQEKIKKIPSFSQKISPFMKMFKHFLVVIAQVCVSLFVRLREGVQDRLSKRKTQTAPSSTYEPKPPASAPTRSMHKSASLLSAIMRRCSSFFPRPRRVISLFQSFSYEHKIMALAMLALIFIVPLLIFIWTKPKEEPIGIIEEATEEIVKPSDIFWLDQWEQEKEVFLVNNDNTREWDPSISSPEDIVGTYMLDNLSIIITSSAITLFEPESQQKQSVPLNLEGGSLQSSTLMEDLSLIFLLTENNTLYSFSPITSTFQKNTLPLPENARPTHIASYLTYLYVWDENQSQIWRFPRIEGGFSEPESWLEEETNLSTVDFFSIDANILTASASGQVTLLSGGEIEKDNWEDPFVPIDTINDALLRINDASGEKVYVALLDAKNGRVLMRDTLSGEIFQNIVGESLIGALRIITFDEKRLVILSRDAHILEITLR